MSRQLISYDDLAPVSSSSSSGAEAGPSSMKLPSSKAKSIDAATSSPASATGTEKMTYSQRKRIKRKKKQDARSRELNHQSKKSPQSNKKAKHSHHETLSSVEADSMMQATSSSSDIEPAAIHEAEDENKDQNGADESAAGETYDEYGYYDDKGHYYYDEEGNSFYFDPYAEDEEEEEDEMTMLNTNIMIPDILEHLRSAADGNDCQQSSEMESYEEEVEDVDGEGGRVLEPEEIWSDDALTLAWTAARETLLHANGLPVASTHSALWYDSPTPGSVAARKAKRESDMNLERRKLLAWQEEKRKKEEAARRAEDEEDEARNEAVSAVRAAHTNGASTQQVATSDGTAGSSSIAPTTVSRASPVKSRLGGRSIPPSIGLPGNQAWRDACKTVAATRNQVGPEVAPQSSSTSKVNGVTHSQPQGSSTPAIPMSASGATAVALPPIAGSTFPPPAPAAAPNSIPSTGNAQQDQILQNIANAWYYAGYYTAQWHWMTSAGSRQQ